MTLNEKKEYLKQYKYIDNRINRKIEEYSLWYSRATKVTTTYSDMPKADTGQDKIQASVEQMVLLSDEINKDVDTLVDLRADIEKAINLMDDEKLKDLLYLRYIRGMTWELVAEEMEYNYSYIVHDLHEKALKKVKIQ